MNRVLITSAPRLERRKAQWEIPGLGRVKNEGEDSEVSGRLVFISRDLPKVLAQGD